MRLHFSDAALITNVLLSWRSFISVTASLMTQIAQGIPIDSSVPEAEYLIGGRVEDKLFSLEELFGFARKLVEDQTNFMLLGEYSLVVLEPL